MKELKELLVSLNERVDKLEHEIHCIDKRIEATMEKLEKGKYDTERDIFYLKNDIRDISSKVNHTHYRDF